MSGEATTPLAVTVPHRTQLAVHGVPHPTAHASARSHTHIMSESQTETLAGRGAGRIGRAWLATVTAALNACGAVKFSGGSKWSRRTPMGLQDILTAGAGP